MLRSLLIVLGSIFYFGVYAQTKIVVNQSEYANETVLFYTHSDYVTFLKDTMAFVRADEKGALSIDCDLTTTKEVFVDLGVYHCSFFAEGGREVYELNLPEKRNKTKTEALNIYFEPIEIRLGIKNNSGKDLNNLIASFDKIYAEFTAKNFDTIYHFPQGKLIEKFEKDISNYYSEIDHEYFKDYYSYKIYELKYLGPNRSYKTITKNHYNLKSIHYHNPSYMNLFNMMYKDFFNYYSATSDGKDLYNVISQGRSVKKLISTLDMNLALSDSLLEELIILKGINDEVFNPKMPSQIRFPRPQVKIILDSIANFSQTEEHRNIANNILKKVKLNTKKKINTEAPNFKLLSLDGSTVNSETFKGKYIYLNFMRTDIVPAMESMDRLINFHKNHKDDIEIISIFTDEKTSDFFKLDREKYPWTILHIGEKRNLLLYYNQITWPQFHLISPEGKLLASPAASLQENFEMRFFELINSEK